MTLFSRKSKLPRNAKFDEKYFLNQIDKITWGSESNLGWGFFTRGDDPEYLKNSFSAKQKNEWVEMLSGTPLTFVCITNWRIISGWVGTGAMSSFPFDLGLFETFDDKHGINLRFSDNPTPTEAHEVSTFVISEEFRNLFLAAKNNVRPGNADMTSIYLIEEDWNAGSENAGQELIARMAMKQSGEPMLTLAVCESCGLRTGSPDKWPAGSFDFCRLCLRKNTGN